MCQIAIERIESDTLQQATTLRVSTTGTCDHGGEVYMRVLWNDGQVGPETAAVQVDPEFQHLPVHFTAHNKLDRIHGVRVILRCKATTVHQEAEI